MAAVGVVQRSWSNLAQHKEELQCVLNLLFEGTGNTAAYQRLENYYYANCEVDILKISSIRLVFTSGNKFKDYVARYGINIFAIWKNALLKRRILLYHTPPVMNLCSDVHWTHFISLIDECSGYEVRYLLTLFDSDKLQHSGSWIACTTEALYQDKKDLYSICASKSRLLHGNYPQDLEAICDVTSRDHDEYRKLLKMPDDMAERYFVQRNGQISGLLNKLGSSRCIFDPKRHLKELGLHPKFDLGFIREFIRQCGINVQIGTGLSDQNDLPTDLSLTC